ncbi:MAG TPA: AAA family ATPase [Verrucomicrobiae bacterium]|nr:AAA family ATPase [Verrucomicrobiae bacterium]
MYEAHFNLRFAPFGLTPDTRFYFAQASHQEALNTLLVALRSGEGFLKVTGEVGLGKTQVCRQLLNALSGADFVTAYVPNPTVSPRGLLQTVAEELSCDPGASATPEQVLKAINRQLLDNAQRQVRTALIIDEAQALSAETLEAVRLLTNLETETCKLLQVVLFGQPELDQRLARDDLRQLRQRITFSYRLQPLTRTQFDAYVRHRVEVAGATTPLFSEPALRVLYRASRGTPRLANILCHKALLAAFGPGRPGVGRAEALMAIYDTEGADIPPATKLWLFTQENLGLVCLALVVSLALAYVLSFGLASWLGTA